MDAPRSRAYHQSTIYLTEEQRQWLTRLAAQAGSKDRPCPPAT